MSDDFLAFPAVLTSTSFLAKQAYQVSTSTRYQYPVTTHMVPWYLYYQVVDASITRYYCSTYLVPDTRYRIPGTVPSTSSTSSIRQY